MKMLARVAIAIVLVVLVAYPASAWYLGRQVEAALMGQLEQAQAVPYFKVVERHYERGLFVSNEMLRIELFGDIIRTMEKARPPGLGAGGAAEPMKPVIFTVHSRILHGPLPGFSKLAAARVDSVLEADPRFRASLGKVLGEQAILSVRTTIRLDGAGESAITSPAFRTTLPGKDGEEVQVDWRGVQGTMQFAGDFENYSVQLKAPGLETVDGRGGKLRITDMRYEGRSQRVFADEPLLYAGPQKFSVGEVHVADATGGPSLVLRQATYDVAMPVNGEFVDIIGRIGVREAHIGGQNYGPAHYDLSLKHLHGRALAQVYRTAMQIQSDPAAMEATADPTAAFGALGKPLLQLLEHDPEFSLDRLSFQTAHGEVHARARARFDGVNAGDATDPSVLIAKLEASADIALPEALLMMPFGPVPASVEAAQAQMRMREQQVAALIEQGYVIREGMLIKSNIAYKAGRLTVNGLPFDPMALQGGPPPSVQAVPPARR